MPSKELIAASSRPLVLSILAEGETYGYAIIQRVREQSGGKLEWSEGMLYPVLHRLERQRLVKSFWRTAENGRKRKYYKLVRRGAAALAEEQRQWMAVHQALAAFWGPIVNRT
jgi:PadR family transcriptional regulator, regulatory protein PadR